MIRSIFTPMVRRFISTGFGTEKRTWESCSTISVDELSGVRRQRRHQMISIYWGWVDFCVGWSTKLTPFECYTHQNDFSDSFMMNIVGWVPIPPTSCIRPLKHLRRQDISISCEDLRHDMESVHCIVRDERNSGWDGFTAAQPNKAWRAARPSRCSLSEREWCNSLTRHNDNDCRLF